MNTNQSIIGFIFQRLPIIDGAQNFEIDVSFKHDFLFYLLIHF